MTFANWGTRQAAAPGFQSNGYRSERAATDRYARLVEFAPLRPEKAHSYTAEIERIRHALRWSIDDFARAGLGQLRGEFCQELPLATVYGEVVEEIADDLDYLDASTAEAKRRELGQLRIHLIEKIAGNGAVDEAALRSRLHVLSQLAAQAREAQLLKLDWTRTRLAIIAGAIIAVLLGVLIIMPPGLLSGLRHAGDLRERYLWLILMFGALGGLISASMDRRSIEIRASEFHLYRQMLTVRTLVGATIALVVYLALTAKLIAIKGIGMSPLDPSYLVIAFAAGLVERAFASQLWKINEGASVESSTAYNPMRT